MTANTLAIVVGLIGVVAGFAAGWIFSRMGSADARARLNSEQRLQEAEDQLQSYRDDVEVHFRTTAELVNRLTSDYREVHNHLAEGAGRLCPASEDGPAMLQTLTQNAPGSASEEADKPGPAQPPLDYAPRQRPEEPGVLHEDYGIEKPAS